MASESGGGGGGLVFSTTSCREGGRGLWGEVWEGEAGGGAGLLYLQPPNRHLLSRQGSVLGTTLHLTRWDLSSSSLNSP